MPRIIRQRTLAALLLAAWLSAGAFAQGNTQPPADQAPPPAPTLVVHELLVVQADRYSETAGDPAQVPTTLDNPIPHRGRAKSIAETGAYLNSAMPLGLITFAGRFEHPLRVEVRASQEGAALHAHWPKDVTGQQLAVWRNVHEARVQKRFEQLGSGEHWLKPLRDADDRLWLATNDTLRKERFLLYDVSFPFDPGLTLSSEDDAYRLHTDKPTDPTPPLAILVHRLPHGWATDPQEGPRDNRPSVRFGPKPAPEPNPQQPADQDSTRPGLDAQLAPLAKLLSDRGYNAIETAMALEMVQAAGIAKSEMSLVYVLPEGGADDLVRLDIKPRPDQIVRTAIVVLNNIDPDLGSRVKVLIAELGNPSWPARDKAQRELEAMGKAAVKQLQDTRGHSDPEIAFRVQQVLEAYDLSLESSR